MGTTDQQRFGLRCRRCARTQPPQMTGSYQCVYCGAPLPIRRWIAHPPPGSEPIRRARLLRRPYSGPPSYRGVHPMWGFPPVIWRGATVAADTADRVPPRVRGMGIVTVLAAATAVACWTAAGAEIWRFTLLLAGRTRVLAGGPVRASDVLVVAAGASALALGVITALAAIPLMVTLHRAAALRAGRAPSRSGAGIVARLVVPGWNLYGAGQILMEIVGGLALSDVRRRSARVIAPLWWLAWVANGLLVVATLVMAFGRSNQIVADTVEMHIVLDVLAGIVAGLFAVVMASLSRSWRGRGSGRFDGWSVRPPDSTARNRSGRGAAAVAAGPDLGGVADPATSSSDPDTVGQDASSSDPDVHPR